MRQYTVETNNTEQLIREIAREFGADPHPVLRMISDAFWSGQPHVFLPDDWAPGVYDFMLKDGRLEGVRISGNTLVTISSLQARQTKRAGQEGTVHAYLKKRAKAGDRVIFYEPIMAQVGMKPRVPADRSRIGGILGEISRESFAEHRVMLSVLVHRKTAGVTRPGKGFFDLAHDLQLKWKDDDAFVKEQTDKVLAAYS